MEIISLLQNSCSDFANTSQASETQPLTDVAREPLVWDSYNKGIQE